MNDEILFRIIGYIVRYVILKLHFPSPCIWKCKSKGHPMRCSCRNGKKVEVHFQLIHNPTIEGGE
jgi:hypothetical protein